MMTRVLLLLIRTYQLLLSPFIGGQCRFEPSCSRYTAQSIERFGAWHGSVLGVKRICRCHPFTQAGFDPVPEQLPDGSVAKGSL
jgi:putative membrane protein insertion efficiency factor